MATSSTIRTKWDSYVFGTSTATAITDKIYNYDLTLYSAKELAKYKFEQQVNCFIYTVARGQRVKSMSHSEQTFVVTVQYLLETDVSGDNYNTLVDNFETIDGLVSTGLGKTWQSSVDFYYLQDGPPKITKETIENLPIWKLEYQYFGIKNI